MVFFEMNNLLIIILKMTIGIKNPIIIPNVEPSITDILVVSIVCVSELYAISIKDDNVNEIEKLSELIVGSLKDFRTNRGE